MLRFHESAVNAVAVLKDGRLVTGGEDGRIAIWKAGRAASGANLRRTHGADRRARGLARRRDASRPPPGTAPSGCGRSRAATPRVLEGHNQNVNGVAFTPDGKSLVSAGYDPTVRIWPLTGDGAPVIATLPTRRSTRSPSRPTARSSPPAPTAIVYFLSPRGEKRGELEAAEIPIISLAISPDGALVAAAGIRGSVAIIERKARKLARTLVGPGLPVWSVAFLPDSKTLLTGGTDRMVRRWDAATGDHIGAVPVERRGDPLAAYAGDRGAEVYRACIACHTLSPDEGNRAGPTLAGIFGRRIATLPGYNFSDALKKLDIVWTPETVAKLFEVGPDAYTPGTKMPEQTIGSAEDRKALVSFWQSAVRR